MSSKRPPLFQNSHFANLNSATGFSVSALAATTSERANESHLSVEDLLTSNRFHRNHSAEASLVPVHVVQRPLLTKNQRDDKIQKKVHTVRIPRGKFERKNRKPVIRGNNDSGRMGKRRCALCRKRHLKCVFTSLDSPCQLCEATSKAEPCIKSWGPKTSVSVESSGQQLAIPEPPKSENNTGLPERESLPLSSEVANDDSLVPFVSSVSLSRPVTIYDPSIDRIDIHILKVAYQAFTSPSCPYLVRRLIPKFSLVYGSSISHPSLRHAVILFCRGIRPEFSGTDELARQRQRARRALGQRLKRPEALDEGDLFAAFFIATHFGFANDNQSSKYIRGFLAIVRHFFNDAIRHFTKSTFHIFWQLLLWDISSWNDLDMEILTAGLRLDFVPWRYKQWSSFLDVPLTPSVEKRALFELSGSYFMTLKAIFTTAQMNRKSNVATLDDRSIHALIREIGTHLETADEPYGHKSFEYHFSEGWTSSALMSPTYWFMDLLHYSFCRLILDVLLHSPGNFRVAIAAATRLFEFFSLIEHCMVPLETRLLDECGLLAPGSDIEPVEDPSWNEVRRQLRWVQCCRDQIVSRLAIFCQSHHDLIESLLVDVIHSVPTRTRDGQLGLLTVVFLNQFGWNSSDRVVHGVMVPTA